MIRKEYVHRFLFWEPRHIIWVNCIFEVNFQNILKRRECRVLEVEIESMDKRL